MILIVSVITTLLLSIIFKSFLFKLLKVKIEYWPYIAIVTYVIISCFIYFNYLTHVNSIEYFVLHLLLLTSYILFLTIVFNESPSVFFLQNIRKKELKKSFLEKKFVKHRFNLLKKKKLIINNKKLSKKGTVLYRSIIFLSNTLLNDIN